VLFASAQGPTCLIFDSAGSLFFSDSGPEGATGLFNPTASVFVARSGGGGGGAGASAAGGAAASEERTLHAILPSCLASVTSLALSPSGVRGPRGGRG